MNDFANACPVEEQRRKTAKELLESMGCILREMEDQISMISDAVYRGGNCEVKEPANEPRATPPMVVIMQEQRDTAEHLLKEILKIREALW